MPKISVIIPVYNVEKYINKCVNSIISQTLEDIEIILVDDGSTDSSGKICDNFSKLDNRIKVIHKKNAGLGAAYNTGMDAAKGEYIGFVEADDFAASNMYEELYSLAETNRKPDIIKSSWYRYFSSKDSSQKDGQMDAFPHHTIIDIKDFPDLLCRQCSVWSAIYKTEMIRNNNIRYLETPGASYQDVDFTYKAFCNAKSIVITPNGYIYYRQDNDNSSVNSKEKSEVIFWEYEEVDRFFSERPDIKEWANESKLIKQFYDYRWNFGRIAPHLKHNFIKRFAKEFKKYRDNKELTPLFYAKTNEAFLNDIMSYV